MNPASFLNEQDVSLKKEFQLQNFNFQKAEKDYFLKLKVSINKVFTLFS